MKANPDHENGIIKSFTEQKENIKELNDLLNDSDEGIRVSDGHLLKD